MTSQVVTQGNIETWQNTVSNQVATQANFETWFAETAKLTLTQGLIEVWASPINFTPTPPGVCQATWPPGIVSWVTPGTAFWVADAPNPAPSGQVMGMTLTTLSADFAIVSGTILAQQYTLYV